MNRSVKIALIVAACNSAALALAFLITDAQLLLLLAMGVVVELILAIIFLATKTDSQLGSGLLLAVGITLLVGLGVCSFSGFG